MKTPMRQFESEQPPEPDGDPIRLVTSLLVAAIGQVPGVSDHEVIRRRILDHAKKALEAREWGFREATIDGQSDYLVSGVGLFHLAFRKLDYDYHDLHAQEVLFERIDREITTALDEAS